MAPSSKAASKSGGMSSRDKGKGGKGEMSDMKARLAAVISQGSAGVIHGKQGAPSAAKDPTVIKRNLFKTILHYMTINVDMSALFPQMIIAATPNSDLVLKKMLYLYICTYAQQKPDLTLLAINTLTKDCGDSDPTIRGLALRSLCSLRVPNLIEYLLVPLKTALTDRDAYVRRTAALGVLKVFRLDPAVVEEQDFEGKLKELFANDNDAQVVANCLTVLQQIVRSPEDLVTKPVVYSLLNRLKQFSEWSQCAVLEFVSGYLPANSDETFDIMNVLEDRLQHSNSAVVLATVRVFLHLTVAIPDVHQQVLERIKTPLYTMMHNKGPEISYAIAAHLRLLVQRAPMLFSSDYKQFFCRYNDNIHVKKLKLDMLTVIADDNNAYEIVNELCEYATDPNVTVARESVKAVGTIAMNLRTADGLVERLLSFLDMQMDHITSETYIVMADILRCLPEHADKCVDALSSLRGVDLSESEGRAAMAWILGSFGEKLQDSPYILEGMAESFEDEEPSVQLALLTSATKLFFKRPPECHRMLSEMLERGAQCANQDVHDRTLFYSRLLRRDMEAAARVVGSDVPPTATFSEQVSSGLADKLFSEFNSLSVVYNQSASNFLAKDSEIVYDDEVYYDEVEEAGEVGQAEKPSAAYADTNLLDLSDDVLSEPSPQQPAPIAQDPLSILDSLEGLAVGASEPAPAAPAISLSASPQMDAALFQQAWAAMATEESFSCGGAPLAPKMPGMSAFLKGHRVFTMASGGQVPTFKFFLYAQQEGSATKFLVQLIADTNQNTVSCVCKSDNGASLVAFVGHLRGRLDEYVA